MADSTRSKDQTQDQQATQETNGGPDYPFANGSQESFDSSFMEMIGSQGGTQNWDIVNQVVTSYFDTLEQSHRQARRIADLWAQSLILQQTRTDIVRAVVPLVTKSVLAELQRHPELTQPQR